MFGPLLAVALASQGAVKIEPTTYLGWDAIRMSNGVIEAVIVPGIGRLMHLARVGQPNLLWVNPDLKGKQPNPAATDWQNYGGDKLWEAPQSRWGWPPDPAIDLGPFDATTAGPFVVLRGPTSAKTGLSVRRTFWMDPVRPHLQVLNRMTNSGPELRAAIWQVAQVDDPLRVEYTIPAAYRDRPIWLYPDTPVDVVKRSTRVEGQTAVFHRDRKVSYKIGIGPLVAGLTAVFPTGRLRLFTSTPPHAEYVDEGKAWQIYGNQDPIPYVELEVTSPYVTMPTGSTRTLVTNFELSD